MGRVATACGPPALALIGIAIICLLFPVAAHADDLYVVNGRFDTVSQYTIEGDGSLEAKTPDSLPTGSAPKGIVVSPDGRSAYVADGLLLLDLLGASIDAGREAEAEAPGDRQRSLRS